MNNKVKTGLVVGSLVGALAFTGCSKKTENVESTTEVVTEVSIESNELIINGKTPIELAKESYNKYNSFYDSKNVDVQEISNMINIINGNVSSYTEAEVSKALELVQYIMLSDNNIQIIDNSNATKLGYETEKASLVYSPKMSEILDSVNVSENITKYEELRDKVLTEISTNGSLSESTETEVKQAVVNMEVAEYNSSNGNMVGDIENNGSSYVIATAKLSLCNLCTLVSPETVYLDTGKGYDIKVRYADDEYEFIGNFNRLQIEGLDLSDEEMIRYAEIRNSLISTKYIDNMCTLEDQMKEESSDYRQNRIESLNNKKEQLKLAQAKSLSYRM